MLCWVLLLSQALLAASYLPEDPAWVRAPPALEEHNALGPAAAEDHYTQEKRAMLAMLSRWRPLTSAVYTLLRPRAPRPSSQELLTQEQLSGRRPLSQRLRFGR